MKSDYRVRARHFMDRFWNYISDCHEFRDYRNAVNKFNKENRQQVVFAHGISRIAFITSDYVIKFDYDYREIMRVGGCEDEVEFYEFAKSEGFAHLFAEITPFFFHNRMFYIMPKINGIGKYSGCWIDRFLNGDDYDFCARWLEDLHDENYGWYNGYPIIVDYACNRFMIERTTESYDDSNISSYHSSEGDIITIKNSVHVLPFPWE